MSLLYELASQVVKELGSFFDRRQRLLIDAEGLAERLLAFWWQTAEERNAATDGPKRRFVLLVEFRQSGGVRNGKRG